MTVDGTESEGAAETDLGFAVLDDDRYARRGQPEAVYCAGKTPAQLAAIAAAIAGRPEPSPPILFTRADAAAAAAIRAALPDPAEFPDAALLAWPAQPPPPAGGTVIVVTAGTSDLPVALEAVHSLPYLGRRVQLVADIGVAGLHRLQRRLDLLRTADCLIVVAGMDGALPSVVAGLVAVPVVGVPTSVGYGAVFGGLAPLLAMLSSCAPGVAVVNIDNGYGAAHFAAQVTRPRPEPSGG
jgi:NCAIR mutase (PurE)-related protein